jgi:acetyl esterase/lipase
MRLVHLIAAAILLLVGGRVAAQERIAQERISLWQGGVPGFEARASILEESADYWTRSVNDPSITVYLPDPAKATGTGIVVVPGGGHSILVTTAEGEDVARWLNARGVAAFVLRYRLYREKGSPYALDDARADMDRAMRLVRSRANSWGIRKLGVIGFSAGGELARMVSLSDPVKVRGKGDAIDLFPARPDFALLLFPGPGHAAETITKASPPLFLAAANDDDCCSQPPIDLLTAYREAGASAELHIYRAGGHAYNLGERTELVSLKHSLQQIEDWLSDLGLLGHPAPSSDPHYGAPPPEK